MTWHDMRDAIYTIIIMIIIRQWNVTHTLNEYSFDIIR